MGLLRAQYAIWYLIMRKKLTVYCTLYQVTIGDNGMKLKVYG